MSELTNIHARSVKDLTTPTELPVDTDALDQVKLVAGNFPAEYVGNEALTVKQIKDLATVDLESKKANKTDVEVALSNLSTTANKFYPTLSEANSHLATMSVNAVVTIGEEANKGLWYKATAGATTLTKSAYDPLTQANNYTNNKAIATKTEAVAIAKNYTDLVFDAVPTVIAPYVAQAEAAATAATISAGVFETPEAGVDTTTGVKDGEYFNVRSPSSDSYIDEYQNIGGSAVATGKSYLSALGVQQQEKPANTIKDARGKTQQDINDSVGAKWYAKGGGYPINYRVMLDNGGIVKSTIANNTNNPNVDMTGWVESSFISLNDISELPENATSSTAYVKHVDSFYVYDSANTTPLSLNGWVLQHSGTVSTEQMNIANGADITALLSYAVANKLFIELPADHKFTTTTFTQDTQSVLVGDGSVQYVYDYLSNDNTEHVAPKIAKPYKKDSIYGWYDSVEARGNFEHGAGYSLMVNSDSRPQVCGFRTKQQQKNYPSVDMVGLYTHVESPRSVTLSNCTFTANSVYSPDLTTSMDIRVGDFIRTEGDPAINKPWRSEITSIDFETKMIGVTWWLHESGGGEGIPPNGLTCQAPYTNGLWGHNTNVFLHADRSAQTIIGYELGVYSEKTRDKFTSMDGFYSVNLTSQVARAQNAFKTSGTWDHGLGAYDCTNGVYTNGTTKYGLNFAPTPDANSSAIRYDLNTRNTGNIVQSVAGVDTLFSISALGVVSHERQDYRVCSASDIQHALSPTLVIGANTTEAHTTTIDKSNMPSRTILTFRQLDSINWTIVAGANTYVLNKAGAMDYLQLYFDGSGFLKLFAGKSL